MSTDAGDYAACALCPRCCRADRTRESAGFCRSGDRMELASAVLHFGEEPPISGTGGSGTLFFSSCTLGCPSCQNIQISRRDRPLGRVITPEEGADICMELQRRGAENINIVTGTHYIPSLVFMLRSAGEQGLNIPVVWNSSGFETAAGLAPIDPLIDIYLIDVKTLDAGTAERFCGSSSYPEAVKAVLPWIAQRNPLSFHEEKLTAGVLVRHLMLPGEIESTAGVLAWFSSRFKDQALLSVMLQFIDPRGEMFPEVSAEQEVLRLLKEYEINDGFIQETGNEEIWLPDFSRPNPFPAAFAKPVWHWKHGFIGQHPAIQVRRSCR